jgi:hypothetical protein
LFALHHSNKPISHHQSNNLGKRETQSGMVATPSHGLVLPRPSLESVRAACRLVAHGLLVKLGACGRYVVPIVSESKLQLTSKTIPTYRDSFRRYSRHSQPTTGLSKSLDSTLVQPVDTSSSSVLHAVKLAENQLVVCTASYLCVLEDVPCALTL